MYIYLDKQGVVKEIINDEALRQSASNVNEIYVYYDGLQETDIGSVLATYGLPDGTITDEMQVATQTQESEIPYNAERDLKYFQYYKAYAFYHFAIADLALSQEGVVRLMVRLAQKDGEYIKVAGLICFDVEGELVKEDHGISVAQYNYLVKAWYEIKECLPLDGSKAMQGNLDMGVHNVILNGKALKDNNGALNYNGKDLAKQEDVSSLQGDVASLKADNTKNKSDIDSLKTDNVANKADISALKTDNTQNKSDIVGLQNQIDTINATQNVVDIVGTKAELNAYATKDLHANDKIEVLTDESQNNANTIYEWNGNAWSLVGSKAPYYSKAESDVRYNELKAKSYDKDTTEYVTGHVPDSGLVKKSLDGISESVETTKIEVGANKKNIATLQSDVSNLKADNQTTKTTITGLVNDNATNKENITTLQSDVSSLKTDNQTTKTTIARLVSSDTQNKADISALKTKSYDKDATLDDLTQGHVPDSNVVKGISVDVKAQKQMLDTIGDEVIKSVKKDTDASLKSLTLPSASDLKTKDGTGFGGGIPEPWQVNDQLLGIINSDGSISGLSIIGNTVVLGRQVKKGSVTATSLYLAPIDGSDVNLFRFVTTDGKVSVVDLPQDFFTKSMDIHLGDININKTEIAKKQVQLYHHTITLNNVTNGAYFTFSMDSTRQAKITKDTLFNVLNGYIAVGTGIVGNMFIDKISFRNTAEKTKVHQYASFGACSYINAEDTFAMFGTDYTLEDMTYPLA